MAWIGLYPFLIFHFLFSKSDVAQKINLKETKVRRPHEGLLLYEKRGYENYKNFENKIKKFLDHAS